MSTDGWITVSAVAAMVLAMALNLAGPDMVLVAGLTVLLAFGVIEPAEAFIGFSNHAVVTIAALFVVAAGVRETGGLDYIARRVLGAPRFLWGAQLRMMIPVSGLSAFLNNTPVVAMFVPLVQDWARRSKISASMLLMPLSYAAILGGTCTLIGTSTNLVVAGMAESFDATVRFGMFDITWLGLPVLFVGTAFVVVLSRWLLKDRGAPVSTDDAKEYTFALRVDKGSPVIGQTIGESLRALESSYAFELERDGHVMIAVPPSTLVRQGDTLRFAGAIGDAVDLRKLGLVPEEAQKLTPHPERRWVEAVVAAHSPLVGATIKQSGFRTNYNAAIIAVHRGGARLTDKVGDIELDAGDVLLLEAHPQFLSKHRRDAAFALVAEVEGSRPPRHDKAALATSILLVMVVVNTAGLLPLLTAALVAAGAMLATRCLTGEQARRSLEIRVLTAVAAAFGIGVALQKSGAAAVLGTAVVDLAMPLGPVGLLVAIYAATAILAGIVSTTAAAAMMFPIAANAAAGVESLGLVPTSLVLMIAASTAFSTPIGYQTNLMVLGPGGYKYADFLRIGLPLQFVVGMVTVTMAWLVYL